MNSRHRFSSKTVGFLLLFMCAAVIAAAHPMGNFSINHYARLTPRANSVDVLYVLDLAELPTFQLLREWGVTKESPGRLLEAKARAEAAVWMKNLRFSEAGASVTPKLGHVSYVIQDGAGGLPVIRINAQIQVPGRSGTFEYEDRNFPDRSGWKEVVLEGGSSAANAEPSGADRSHGLTAYPQDPTVAPPQQTTAHFEYSAATPKVAAAATAVTEAVPARAAMPHPTGTPAAAAPVITGAVPAEANSLGTVKRNDFLSRTLTNSKGPLPWGLALLCMAAAFGIGALHAVEPGHGKTMVAAYLVGSRGTFQQAIFLGAMVTFTHTISVFALGLVTLFLSQYLLPDTLIRTMSVISGVSIVWIGGLLLYRRSRKLLVPQKTHHHHHHHEPQHAHSEGGHSHSHDHGHHHHHDDHDHHHHDHVHHNHDHQGQHAHSHTHDGHTHSHVPEGEVSLGSLIALGVSGGLVPCPAALVLLLSCISIGRPGLGLLLLLFFSVGLALVLMGIGMMVLVVKRSVPKSDKPSHAQAWAKYAPVFSAALIFGIGIYMTGVALGAFPVVRMIG